MDDHRRPDRPRRGHGDARVRSAGGTPLGPEGGRPERRSAEMQTMDYIRFAVLGDSASCGVGDPTPDGWRGWARLLADAIAEDHHVSLCNLARPGAVAADVRHEQLRDAVAHRPVLVSLVVGIGDVLRVDWDPAQARADLLHCAGALARQGALVVTVRFHDHTRVLGLPSLLARPLRRRIEALNTIYDEVHERYGGLRLDLGAEPGIYARSLWSADRLHLSELGHRYLAHRMGELLDAEGLRFSRPSLTCTGPPLRRRDGARHLLRVASWMFRRLREVVLPTDPPGARPQGTR